MTIAGRRRRRIACIAIAITVLVGLPILPGLGDAVHLAPSVPSWSTELVLALAAIGGGPVPPNLSLQVTVALEPEHAQDLQAFDVAVQDPESPEYHHFLSEGQFEARYSPKSANLTDLENYFSGFGARNLHVSADRLGLTFAITASGVDRAFSAHLALTHTQYGPLALGFSSNPTLPAPLLQMVSGVDGLSGSIGPHAPTISTGVSDSHPHPTNRLPQFLSGTGPLSGTQWFVGSDYVGLYNETPLLPGYPASRANASFASSEAVATLLMSGYNETTGQNLPPWDPAQIDGYLNATLPPAWPKTDVVGVPVVLAGIAPPAPGPSFALNDDSRDVVENSLDLEMAGSMAPGAKIANFYFPASLEYATPASTTDADLADDFANELSNALAYNYSPQRLASVSASFGIEDLNDTLWNSELVHAAAIGVTVVASSGDAGNAPKNVTGQYLGAGPGWPASAAFNASGVISVGGTSIESSGNPTGPFDGTHAPALSYDNSSGPLRSETVWYNTLAGSGNVSGSEGGGAPLYSEPRWQFDSAAQPSIASAEGSQGLTSLSRAEPDLSLSANTTIAYTGTRPNGSVQFSLLQGTSVSAPLFAGMVAEWAAVEGHGLGFIDPEIYRIEGYYAAHPGLGDPFLPVSSGSNYLFSAGGGWNAATGWGGVDASRFLTAISNPAIDGYQYSGPTPGLPSPTSVITPLGLALILAVGVLLVGVVVVMVAAGRRSPSRRFGLAQSGFPPGPSAPANPSTSGPVTMFDCPFCGHPRPAEPVRCPSCGQL